MRGALLMVALLVAGNAQAFSGGVAKAFPPLASKIANGARITYGSDGTAIANMARTFATGPISGGALVTEAGLLATPAGDIAIVAARTVAAAAIADALIPLAASFYTGYQAGSLLYEYLGDSRVVPTPTGWQFDFGIDPTDSKVYVWHDSNYGCPNSKTLSGVAGCALGRANMGTGMFISGCDSVSPTPGAQGFCYIAHAPENSYQGRMGFVGMEDTTRACKGSIDALNPIYSRAEGMGPDADGKCRTGRYQPATPAQVKDRLDSWGSPIKAPELVKDIVEHGGEVQASDPTVSGPSSKVGPDTVTTHTPAPTPSNPNPVPETKTAHDTYNYHYDGDTITYNITTNTTNPDGSTDSEEKKPDEPTQPVTDKELPAQPKLYTQVYPNGVPGVWADNKNAFDSTPAMTFLKGLVPSFSDGGCPAFALPQSTVLGIRVGGPFDLPCSVFTFVRACMIIGALFLCRALIFGG